MLLLLLLLLLAAGHGTAHCLATGSTSGETVLSLLHMFCPWRRVKRSAIAGRRSVGPDNDHSSGLRPRVLEALAAMCAELHAAEWDSGVHRAPEAAA